MTNLIVMQDGPDAPLSTTIGYTVVLCTHNHLEKLKRTLSDLDSLSRPEASWELLIIDNASTDGTTEFLATIDWQDFNLPARGIREEKLGLSNARNRGIREARGEYIFFMDDDETPDPEWLTNYEHAIISNRPDALGGRIEVYFEDGIRPRWLQEELLGFLGKLDYGPEPFRLTEPDTPIFGGNFVFRRDIFDRIGDFDAGLGRKGVANIGGEDTEIYDRMIAFGCDVRWVPDAVINHRIQAAKLKRDYFLDLHYREGYTEGIRQRGNKSRLPGMYLFPQLWRALLAAIKQRIQGGRNTSLRKEMNVAYFIGYILGWVFG